MAVKLRLTRSARRSNRSTASSPPTRGSPRDGRFIEILGHYDPRQDPSALTVDNDKAVKWLSQGAQPTERVAKLLQVSGAIDQFKARQVSDTRRRRPPSPSSPTSSSRSSTTPTTSPSTRSPTRASTASTSGSATATSAASSAGEAAPRPASARSPEPPRPRTASTSTSNSSTDRGWLPDLAAFRLAARCPRDNSGSLRLAGRKPAPGQGP